jgi:DNA-binding transcriptional ArsR family regulator
MGGRQPVFFTVAETLAELASAFQALAHPTRVALLDRLRNPATLSELAKEIGVSRQAVRKHIDFLATAGFVHAAGAPRVLLRARRYAANPLMLHSFKETVWGLGGFSPPLRLPPMPTRPSQRPPSGAAEIANGLLLVHGDAPGRWFPLDTREEWTIGRDDSCGIIVPNDVFASSNHAQLQRRNEGWMVTDLNSTNGTWIDFAAALPGRPTDVTPGQVLTVGRTHFVLRGI